MPKPLRALIVEDREEDAQLVVEVLRRGGYAVTFERVQTPANMQAALDGQAWDIVLCDYVMPSFDAPSALRLLQATGCDLPFIIVSGTIGEDVAVESLKQGADDYLLKDNLIRLVPAVERILLEAENRRQRRAAERATRLIMAHSMDVICTLDVDRRFVAVSDAARWMWGYEPAELAGRSIYDLVHPEDRDSTERMARAVVGGQATRDFENRMLRKDGSVVVMMWSAHWSSADGLGFCIGRDITERERVEERLRLEDAALEAAANGIVITDVKGAIIWANPAFTRLTGYTLSEAIGKNPRMLKSGNHSPAIYRELWQTVLSGQVWRGEMRNRRKDGTLYHEQMTITPVRDEQGRLSHFIAIKEDITERKNLEAHLLRTQRLESVGRLASGIAHDLNNILTPVLLAPPTLRAALQSQTALDLVDTVESSARRGSEIIKQLLTFGRGVEGERQPLALRSLVREMIRIVEETFPKNITVVQSIPAELPFVSGDPTQLHQVLMNLCVNARDAMPGGGTLTLGLAAVEVDEALAQANPGVRPGRHLVLSVRDTGTGIAPEHLDSIFDPFFTTKKLGEGTGLGLSTVLGIVRAHNGLIQVNSTPGTGTEFRIFLPVCEAPRVSAPPAAPRPLPQGRGQLVLLVDDEESVRRVTRTTLERNGYQVVEARNGAEGLAVFEGHADRVQMVVTDIMMPVMDGPTFIQAIRKMDARVSIVAVSGYLTESGLPHGLDELVQAVLPKPFTVTTLLETLDQVLRSRTGEAP